MDVLEKESLYLLFAYPESIQPNLTPEQTRLIRRAVETIKGE